MMINEHIAGHTAGHSYVGANAHGEVVLRPNTDWPGRVMFSPGQARKLARLLVEAAEVASKIAEAKSYLLRAIDIDTTKGDPA